MNALFTFNSHQLSTHLSTNSVSNDNAAQPKRVIVRKIVKNTQNVHRISLKSPQDKLSNHLSSKPLHQSSTKIQSQQILKNIRNCQLFNDNISQVLAQTPKYQKFIKTKVKQKCQDSTENIGLYRMHSYSDYEKKPKTIIQAREKDQQHKKIYQNREKKIISLKLSPKIVIPTCNRKLPEVFKSKMISEEFSEQFKCLYSCRNKRRIFSSITNQQQKPNFHDSKYITKRNLLNSKIFKVQDRILNKFYQQTSQQVH